MIIFARTKSAATAHPVGRVVATWQGLLNDLDGVAEFVVCAISSDRPC